MKKYPFLIVSILALVLLPAGLSVSAPTQAAHLSIRVHGALIDVEARDVPLIDLLQALAERTGLALRGGEDRTGVVSVEIHQATLEKCLHQILSHQNYALIFKEHPNGRIEPVKVWILTGQASRSAPSHRSAIDPDSPRQQIEPDRAGAPPEASHPKVQALETNEPLPSYSGEYLIRQLADKEKLAKDFSGEPDDEGGVRITRLEGSSILGQVGLQEGDIVRSVHGLAVSTPQELIERLHTQLQILPQAGPNTTMRIGRINSFGETDPIYFQLH